MCERAPCLRSPDAGTAADGLVRLQALALGSQNRKVAATCMNKESSRSHCCFALSVQITTKEDGTTTRKFSRFNLIDLAGSERQRATNATGDRLKEANNINRSLSALGNVIMALANSNGHVPYRDSKLTFMLKDSIGGNSKTCIIANCSSSGVKPPSGPISTQVRPLGGAGAASCDAGGASDKITRRGSDASLSAP